MKALILSVKAGYGHHSTGLAMKDCLNVNGIECEMLDTLEYISRFLGEGVQEGYLLATKHLKEAYGRVYDSFDKRDEPSKSYSPEALISKFLSKKLEKMANLSTSEPRTFHTVVTEIASGVFEIDCYVEYVRIVKQ